MTGFQNMAENYLLSLLPSGEIHDFENKESLARWGYQKLNLIRTKKLIVKLIYQAKCFNFYNSKSHCINCNLCFTDSNHKPSDLMWRGGGLHSIEEAYCFPSSSPGFESRHHQHFFSLLLEQYWDRTHQVPSNFFHKSSQQWRPELSTKKVF